MGPKRYPACARRANPPPPGSPWVTQWTSLCVERGGSRRVAHGAGPTVALPIPNFEPLQSAWRAGTGHGPQVPWGAWVQGHIDALTQGQALA